MSEFQEMRGGKEIFCRDGKIRSLLWTQQTLLSKVNRQYQFSVLSSASLGGFSVLFQLFPCVYELHHRISQRGKWKHPPTITIIIWWIATSSSTIISRKLWHLEKLHFNWSWKKHFRTLKSVFLPLLIFKSSLNPSKRFRCIIITSIIMIIMRCTATYPPTDLIVQYGRHGGNTPLCHHR